MMMMIVGIHAIASTSFVWWWRQDRQHNLLTYCSYLLEQGNQGNVLRQGAKCLPTSLFWLTAVPLQNSSRATRWRKTVAVEVAGGCKILPMPRIADQGKLPHFASWPCYRCFRQRLKGILKTRVFRVAAIAMFPISHTQALWWLIERWWYSGGQFGPMKHAAHHS